MKAVIIAILAMINITSASSQPPFKKMYGGFSIFNFELIEIPGTDHFLLSNHNNINTDHTFFKLDESGDPYNQAFIYQSIGGGTIGSHHFYHRNDSVYDLIGLHGTLITSYPAVAFVSRRDSSLQSTILSKFYSYQPSGPGISSCLSIDSSYTIGGGYAIAPFQYYPMMFKLDSTLNINWSRMYQDYVGYVQSITQVSDSSYYLMMHLSNEGLSLAKTDSVGTIIWCRNYQQPFRYANKMILLQDGNLLLTGYINPSGTGYAPVEIFLTKVDTSGQIIWSKTYGDSNNTFYKAGQNPTFYVDTASGNNIILTGIFRRQWEGYTDIVAALLDSSGNFIWSRCYGNDFFDEFGSICHQTYDGGFILGGYNNYQINNWPPVYNTANVTVIKTDSLGVSDGCMEYPVTIYSEPDTPLVANLTWSIYVDSIVTEIPSDMVDTTGTPTRNENMCTFVSLMDPIVPSGVKVYPNPSNGIFTIKSEVEILVMEVLDIRGSLVMSQAVKRTGEYELNLSSSPPGIYLVRLITEKEVMMVKAMVE